MFYPLLMNFLPCAPGALSRFVCSWWHFFFFFFLWQTVSWIKSRKNKSWHQSVIISRLGRCLHKLSRIEVFLSVFCWGWKKIALMWLLNEKDEKKSPRQTPLSRGKGLEDLKGNRGRIRETFNDKKRWKHQQRLMGGRWWEGGWRAANKTALAGNEVMFRGD